MRTRRDVLATAGAACAGLLAGCTGTNGGGSGDGTTETNSTTRTLTDVDVPDDPDVTTVDSMPTPVRGDPDADVTVTVFEDYACPHCAHYATEVMPRIVENYTKPGTVRYEHRDFPIPVSEEWSWAGANAARAVQDALDDAAFFEYTHTLFAHQDAYVDAGARGYDYLGTVAADLGADATAVVRAAKGGKYTPYLKAERQTGKDMGVRGTPTVFVNGTATGDPGYDTISAKIDAALSN
ncbi:DsbA family protein [Halarchaeum acidiphilum]|uniref:DsbA family protein n=2 Tax=Halarchaeum acidiphilum TaxID=489138 RepID=UPI000381B484|nr:thioredoxin domain-containing protein [Halarchaeum acidiphilum]